MKKHSSNHFKTSNEAAEERVEEHNRYLRNRKNKIWFTEQEEFLEKLWEI